MVTKRKIDEYYMRRALSLAWRGTGTTVPNPRVGCVLVKEERVLGEGYHACCGFEHAEAAALMNAAERAEDVRGATAYVNLEPCSHVGKMPPCAPRLVKEGIARVVVGMVDPNPKVNSAGLDILREGGVEVSVPCLEKDSKWLNRGFIRSKTLGRPWITLKAATGLDGKMALENGESKWITGKTARFWAHLLRSEHDGILVGVGTIIKDDPDLTVRHTCGKSPLRIILDTDLSLPLTARVLNGGCLVLTCSDNKKKKLMLERAGADVCVLPALGGRVDLNAALENMAARNVQMLMVEGGPKVLSSFMAAHLCDSLALFTSSCVMGKGYGLGEELCFNSVEESIRLKETSLRRVGEDMLLEGVFECSPAL